MSRTLSLAMLVSIHNQTTNEAVIPLLTITHPDTPDVLRFALDGVDVTSQGETYQAFPFDLVVPDDTEDRPPQANLTVGNVDRRLTALLESSPLPCKIDIEIVLASTPDTVEVAWYGMDLREVKYNAQTASGALNYEAMEREEYPKGSISPSYFPGAF
jgi:hypothetical protein